MAIYLYRCKDGCAGAEVEQSMFTEHDEVLCPICHKPMVRDYAAEAPNIQGGDYGRPIVSHSLAMHPEQIPEHQRHFPDIKVQPDGCPVFDNFRQHDNYLKKTGWVKSQQRKKFKGKIISSHRGS